MGCVTYTDLRANLAQHMDEVIESRAPLVVTRQGGRGNVVMMSEEEFEGWQETIHLLSSPRNAARLMASVQQARAGMARERELLPSKPRDPA
ncbi:type II toxin-antitoxin system Phd/YefM family antitoxin [Siccirubricoccus phaeus]|uniref:type II toxin-antitoxin system Phd/YefM family antitoxin n=1 Tax=Siccirubricoccus phaeus TaxID=2595053 RepID=UPI0011F27E10|nr:type II toxin-antitoxin system prevent-host-death family antitoxin [Siccirubricoccus phaeus]